MIRKNKICANNLRSMDKAPYIDSLSTLIHHKKPHKFCFVGLKCQKCCDLCAFLGVKSGLLILVRVKDLTFSNSRICFTRQWFIFKKNYGSIFYS